MTISQLTPTPASPRRSSLNPAPVLPVEDDVIVSWSDVRPMSTTRRRHATRDVSGHWYLSGHGMISESLLLQAIGNHPITVSRPVVSVAFEVLTAVRDACVLPLVSPTPIAISHNLAAIADDYGVDL